MLISELILLRRLSVAAVLLLLASTPWSAPHLSAQDAIGRVSPAEPELAHEAAGIPAIYPVQVDIPQPFAAYRPALCEDVPYCDSFELRVGVPSDYSGFYGVEISLQWPDEPAVNQLTLHVWPDNHPTEGGPLGPCGSPRDETCFGRNPLSLTMVEPDPAEPIYVTIVNTQGINAGYRLRATFRELELDLGDFDELGFDFSPTPTTPAASTEGPNLGDLFGSPEAAELDRPVILVPGPDGELRELEIPTIAAGQREPDTGSRVNPYITAGALIPLLGALAILLVTLRRRWAKP